METAEQQNTEWLRVELGYGGLASRKERNSTGHFAISPRPAHSETTGAAPRAPPETNFLPHVNAEATRPSAKYAAETPQHTLIVLFRALCSVLWWNCSEPIICYGGCKKKKNEQQPPDLHVLNEEVRSRSTVMNDGWPMRTPRTLWACWLGGKAQSPLHTTTSGSTTQAAHVSTSVLSLSVNTFKLT